MEEHLTQEEFEKIQKQAFTIIKVNFEKNLVRIVEMAHNASISEEKIKKFIYCIMRNHEPDKECLNIAYIILQKKLEKKRKDFIPTVVRKELAELAKIANIYKTETLADSYILANIIKFYSALG